MKSEWLVYWFTENEGGSMSFGSKILASLYGAKMLRQGFTVRMSLTEYEWED